MSDAGFSKGLCCDNPRRLVYHTKRTADRVYRYRRCANCGKNSKTVAANFIDQRAWIDRKNFAKSIPDGPEFQSLDAIMLADDSDSKSEDKKL